MKKDNELTLNEYAYIAGLIDSDGCIYCSTSHKRPVIKILVANMHYGLLAFLRKQTSYGSIYKQASCYIWDVTGKQAEKLLEKIIPHLVIKYEQGKSSLNFLNTGDEKYKKQAKEVRHGNFNENNITIPWLSGFFDGDGCVTSHKTNKKLTISLQTTIDKRDENFANALASIYGGYICKSGDNVRWNLKITDSNEEFLKKIAKFSHYKKKQLELAIEYLLQFPRYQHADEEVSFEVKDELSKLKAIDSMQHYITSDFDNYQYWTRTTAIYPKDKALEYLSLGLCSESGEVAGVVKKIMRDNGGEVSEEKRAVLVSELSDCLWYLARLCDELGISLSTIYKYNMSKLMDRLDRGKISGSGDNR